MTRRSFVPLLVLGLLGLLSVGAVVLGLVMAPATPDLLVHNGAGELTYATHVTAVYANKVSSQYFRIEFTAPTHVTESLLKGGPASPPTETRHVQATSATKALAPFTAMRTITGFTPQGSDFVATQPGSTLFKNLPEALRSKVTGSVKFRVSLHGGYLVNVFESFDIHTPVGAQSGTYQYRVTSVNGQPAGV